MISIIKQEKGSAYLSAAGKLGVDTAPELRETLELLSADTCEVIIDAEELQYISSAGLRELLILKKRLPKDGRIRILNAREPVCEVFRFTGFDQFVEVEPVREDYLQGKEYYSFKTMLRQKARERQDAPVIWYNEETFTWGELEKYSQIVAWDLSRLGVKKGSHVGICGKNTLNWVVTFFAIQKLGAIAMLLNVQQKPSEINILTEIGDMEFFCYGDIPMMEKDEAYLEKVMSGGIRACYDFGKNLCCESRKEEYPPIAGLFDEPVEADDPCVFLFTSGSTGRPKGIMHSAYGLLNSAYALGHRLRMTPEDKSYVVLPLYHILGFMDSFIVVLVSGGMIYIAPDTHTQSMLEIISRHRCTVLHCVPTLILAMVNNPEFSRYDLTCIRASMLGGAPMASSQMEMVQNMLPDNHFISGYGLSEMAPVCCTEYVDSREHILSSVGHPLPCAEALVLDPATGRPCGPGETGELVLRGVNMMLCYYKLDIDRQSIDGEGWLHTDDLVTMDEDGYLHFRGRIKELIIRGGENIMPNEVAAALVTHPQVRDVKVMGVPHEILGEEVAACVIPAEGQNPDPEDLRKYLEDRLAPFKIPVYYVFYPEFPLLANGKIDWISLKKDMLEQLSGR
ncbi:MAG: AMP-binding protein [Parasporobacterium sp.]|nr:AMP-binding protein [Parasporobacterium sp.]